MRKGGGTSKSTVRPDQRNGGKTLIVQVGFGFIPAVLRMADNAKYTVLPSCRMQIVYSGHVQGVGFRYTVRSVAAGFDVKGTVRNLTDGRVELLAEGEKKELEEFRMAIREAGLAANIRNEDAIWSEALGGFRGFEIVR